MTDSRESSATVDDKRALPRGWRFGEYTFDAGAAVLRGPRGETVLEPRVCELLVFVCRNPDRVLSRDEIVDAVWHGGVVSDNAVSKLVARLRRDLEDDPKDPRYIQTLSRRGYRFVATVEPVAAGVTPARSPSGKRGYPARFGMMAVLAIVLALAAFLAVVFLPRTAPVTGPLPIHPLTREAGTEFSSAISPDGRLLAYTHRASAAVAGRMRLKDLDTGEAVEPPSDLPTGRLLWLPDGRSLAAQQRVEDRCVVRLLPIDANSEPTDLLSCDDRMLGDLVFSADADRLYFSSRSRAYQPMEIFELDLATGTTTLIAQPPLAGAGNYGIDLSPDGGRLLILSADNSYRSRLHVLELGSGALTAHGRFDHSVERAIWHHDGASVVHLAAPLAYDLVRSDLDGTRLDTIASTASRITEFARHPNGVDFYFSSFQMINDLLLIDLATGAQVAGDNTAVYEHLPTLSRVDDSYLFLSNRSGLTQVFEARVGQDGVRQVTQFPDSRLFIAHQLAPAGDRVLLATYDELLVIDRDSGGTLHRAEADGLILAASWLDDETLAVSLLDQYVDRLFTYDLAEAAFAAQPERWVAAVADGADRYRVERGGGVHRQAADGAWRHTGLTLERTFTLAGLNLRTDRGQLYHEVSGALVNELGRFDPASGEFTALGQFPYVAGFDVAGDRLILSHEVGRTGDIVTSRAADP